MNLGFKRPFIIAIVAIFISFLVLYFYRIQASKSNISCINCNVILVGVDTLSAKHLSSYGYFRNTSPHIDRLAKSGVLFKWAYSQASSTTPSFMSLFTSLYPSDHGIIAVLPKDPKNVDKVNDSITTLPEILQSEGYLTQAFITSRQLSKEVGFGRGFNKFEGGVFTEKREAMLEWIAKNKNKKFFLFFHDMGPHYPYTPPYEYKKEFDHDYSGEIAYNREEMVRESFGGNTKKFGKSINLDKPKPRDVEYLQALYDGEIRDVDDFIGNLFATLEKNNLLKNTIVILTADHGEEFYEHGRFRHVQLYNETIRIPLLFVIPGIKLNSPVENNVRIIDILPTILDALQIKKNIPMRGVSLLPLIENPSNFHDLPVVSFSKNLESKTIILGKSKYIKKKDSEEFYDLGVDPEEKKNIIKSQDEDTVEKLKSILEQTIRPGNYAKKPGKLSIEGMDHLIEELREHGY